MTQERFNAQMEEEFCSELEMMGKKVNFNNLEFNPLNGKCESTTTRPRRIPVGTDDLPF